MSVEVSSIYKKHGRTRKVHNVICLPGFEAVERLNSRLGRIGNLASDGRPILGLDCRDLLEIVLESCAQALFVPAHIWTPHFAVLGASSGFDSLEACYQDLLPHIFAVETGLSSDPPMNRRLSALDRFAVISNSDAHSAPKLGREATCFDTEMSYAGMYDALRSRDPARFTGTIEFHPEEGKYHLDGHRKCGVCCTPAQTRAAGGLCHVCGRKLTVGVLNRVESLADRSEHDDAPSGPPHEYLIPLEEVISCCVGVGPRSKKVQRIYHDLLQHLGPELEILRHVAPERIAACGQPLVAEGVRRMRAGRVSITAGFDGEFGAVGVFTPDERRQLLVDIRSTGVRTTAVKTADVAAAGVVQKLASADKTSARVDHLLQTAGDLAADEGLNDPQQAALQTKGPVAVVGAPGSGKTRTLAGRVAWLVQQQAVAPSRIVAMTLSLKAGQRLRRLLEGCLGAQAADITIGTPKQLAIDSATDFQRRTPTVLDATEARALLSDVLGVTPGSPVSAVRAQARISSWKADGLRPYQVADDALAVVYAGYEERLRVCDARDRDDVVLDLVEAAHVDPALRQHLTQRFDHVLVDDFQDISPAEYQMVRALAGHGDGLFVAREQDAAIPSTESWHSVTRDYPELASQPLGVVGAAARSLLTVVDENEEAATVAAAITEATTRGDRRLRDIAVLVRTEEQLSVLEVGLRTSGIPYRVLGEQSFLQQRGARDAIAFFRFALDPVRPLRLIEALRTGPFDIGSAALASLSAAARSMTQLEEAIAALPTAAAAQVEGLRRAAEGYARRAQSEGAADVLRVWRADLDVEASPAFERLACIAAGHASLAELLDALLVGHEADIERMERVGEPTGRAHDTDDIVTLMTMQAARGQRCRAVFVCGVEDGLLPLRRADAPRVTTQQERRLFHTAVTRGTEQAILICARQRTIDGELKAVSPSPFLADLPACAQQEASAIISGLTTP